MATLGERNWQFFERAARGFEPGSLDRESDVPTTTPPLLKACGGGAGGGATQYALRPGVKQSKNDTNVNQRCDDPIQTNVAKIAYRDGRSHP